MSFDSQPTLIGKLLVARPLRATGCAVLYAVAACLAVLVMCAPSRAASQERVAHIRVLQEMPVPVGSPDVSVVEPFLAVNPADERQRAGAAVRLERGGWRVVAFVTADRGWSWSSPELPGLQDATMAADPWLYWSPDGAVYLSVLAFVPVDDDARVAVWMYTSEDGGQSWSRPVQLPWSERGSYDHAILTSASHVGAGAPIYVVATYGLSGFAVLRSETGPEGFQGPEEYVPDNLNNNLGGAVALDRDRLVFTHFDMSTASTRRPLWAVRSLDGGHTFERTLIRRGVVPWGFPPLAVGPSGSAHSQRLYAVWLETTGQGNLEVMLSYSDDDGMSWSSPVPVNSHREPTFRGRPFVAVNRDGVVGVTWNDRRNATAGLCSDVYFAASLDGGDSFLTEVRVSTITACNPELLDRRWAMGGDYSNMATSNSGRFHIIWGDARTGVHQLYAADVAVER